MDDKKWLEQKLNEKEAKQAQDIIKALQSRTKNEDPTQEDKNIIFAKLNQEIDTETKSRQRVRHSKLILRIALVSTFLVSMLVFTMLASVKFANQKIGKVNVKLSVIEKAMAATKQPGKILHLFVKKVSEPIDIEKENPLREYATEYWVDNANKKGSVALLTFSERNSKTPNRGYFDKNVTYGAAIIPEAEAKKMPKGSTVRINGSLAFVRVNYNDPRRTFNDLTLYDYQEFLKKAGVQVKDLGVGIYKGKKVYRVSIENAKPEENGVSYLSEALYYFDSKTYLPVFIKIEQRSGDKKISNEEYDVQSEVVDSSKVDRSLIELPDNVIKNAKFKTYSDLDYARKDLRGKYLYIGDEFSLTKENLYLELVERFDLVGFYYGDINDRSAGPINTVMGNSTSSPMHPQSLAILEQKSDSKNDFLKETRELFSKYSATDEHLKIDGLDIHWYSIKDKRVVSSETFYAEFTKDNLKIRMTGKKLSKEELPKIIRSLKYF